MKKGVVSAEALVVILGNIATCGQCQAFWGVTGKKGAAYTAAHDAVMAKLKAGLPGAVIVDADKGNAPAAYAKYRPSGSFL